MSHPELKTELMDWNGCAWVESVPERMHGVPVLVNTRMPADEVLENFDDGMSIAELVNDYGLQKDAVLGVLHFAGRSVQARAA